MGDEAVDVSGKVIHDLQSVVLYDSMMLQDVVVWRKHLVRTDFEKEI